LIWDLQSLLPTVIKRSVERSFTMSTWMGEKEIEANMGTDIRSEVVDSLGM